jgi:hypothetical protein
MGDRIASWRKKGVSRVAFCVGGRNFDDSGLLIEGDEALRRPESIESEIILAQTDPESEAKELGYREVVKKKRGCNCGEDGRNQAAATKLLTMSA